jgi:hypothetical protein
LSLDLSLEPKKRNTTNKIKYKEVKYLKKKCVCLSEIKKIRPLNFYRPVEFKELSGI